MPALNSQNRTTSYYFRMFRALQQRLNKQIIWLKPNKPRLLRLRLRPFGALKEWASSSITIKPPCSDQPEVPRLLQLLMAVGQKCYLPCLGMARLLPYLWSFEKAIHKGLTLDLQWTYQGPSGCFLLPGSDWKLLVDPNSLSNSSKPWSTNLLTLSRVNPKHTTTHPKWGLRMITWSSNVCPRNNQNKL